MMSGRPRGSTIRALLRRGVLVETGRDGITSYLIAIGTAIATAADRIEARYPGWEVGAVEVMVRCARRGRIAHETPH